MPTSEIDHIFATKGKGNGSTNRPAPGTSKDVQAGAPKLQRRQKKRKAKEAKEKGTGPEEKGQVEVDADATRPAAKKRRVPETVIDPSSQLEASKTKRPKASDTKSSKPSKRSPDAVEEQEKFTDSRGTGPRRQTEEGWSIYKEDELGISNTGGDTPLCPFDCDCCF